MDLVVTCKHCGTQNRIGEIPRGRRAVCGNCRSVLGTVKESRPKKNSRGITGTAWAWVGILGIAGIAWMVDTFQSRPQKPSTPQPSLTTSTKRPYSSNYSPSIKPAPKTPSRRPIFNEPERALPPHGDITWHSSGEPVAPLVIRSSRGSHYVVKLTDYFSGQDTLSVFIHGGVTANLDVPLGKYRIKYASGERWYGPTHLFGPETAYSRADSSFDFSLTGNQVSGYTLTLYKVIDGNLHTSRISPDEF